MCVTSMDRLRLLHCSRGAAVASHWCGPLGGASSGGGRSAANALPSHGVVRHAALQQGCRVRARRSYDQRP
jgi:hypothetical protein